ncbi:RING-H2 finger protein ATL70 [Eucalyptus grandis]|uniref:RING-type domain-containing protein n=2 Tax=Eucalyptus grandis TaxID=71139 RepID=A0A059A911_EUCGR|nr:RING-H2 finger protein ATL70 [Eucalyptus grandis]KAK3407966.1 hypothetical protein EUGRSUZ_J00293 [Eucalyptus grandis]
MSGTLEFFYGVGIYLVVLTLITLFALASYLCARICVLPPRSHSLAAAEDGSYSVAIALGLDEATLGSFPTLLYSQAKAASWTCCSICLSEYMETDVLRLLPDCGHDFHSKCVDPWLRMSRSCPNCRTLSVPTPVRIPLAEVAPLATSLR